MYLLNEQCKTAYCDEGAASKIINVKTVTILAMKVCV